MRSHEPFNVRRAGLFRLGDLFVQVLSCHSLPRPGLFRLTIATAHVEQRVDIRKPEWRVFVEVGRPSKVALEAIRLPNEVGERDEGMFALCLDSLVEGLVKVLVDVGAVQEA